MALAAGVRLGPYEIIAPLGAGGMGEVYRARDPRLGRDVAIKVLPSAFAADGDRLRRFEQEAHAAAALNHPHILAIYDIGTHDGAPYIVSELLEGTTLREALQGGALPARKAIDYAVQIAHGLAAAHDKGITHRDLKPENLFVTTEGRVTILDFGLAKLMSPASADVTESPTIGVPNTVSGMVLGTIGYMSPEQVRGAVADYRADVFAFGAVLYEMLSGRRAFSGNTPADAMSAILTEDPPDLPLAERHIPPALARIVSRCLEKHPAARFQSTRDLAFALESLSTHSERGQLAAVAAIPVRRSRERLAWSVAGALLVACVALAALTIRGASQSAIDTPPEMRLQIEAPPGTALSAFAISPDGLKLVARVGDARTAQLWLRLLQGDTWQPLEGTDDPNSPFWSPDSDSVAFASRGELKRIDISTGLVRKLADRAGVAGGAWSDDGTLFVTRTFSGPIYVQPFPGPSAKSQISTSGGTSVQWRPDGRELYYVDFEDRITAVPVRLDGATVEVGIAQALLEAGESFAVAPDGRFLVNTIASEPSPFTVLLNWDQELKQRVPTR